MAINKVEFGDQTLIDLTSDTVSSDKLLSGETAHDRSGNQITGSVVVQNYSAGDGIDISANNEISVDTAFTDASTRTNISSGDTLATIWGKIKKFFSDLKTVAFSGSYNDLSDQPTIPTVGNGTLTIQKNGTNVTTFTANQSGNATANITVPTKTSELTNDSGFLTSHQDISGKANAKPNVSGNMNQAASYGNALGMINLSGSNTNINPNGQTGWHHFINMSYNTEASNMWQTQLANKAGTTDLWIRSRSGGSIVDGTAWAANWVRLAKSTEIPTNTNQLTNGAGFITSSGSCASATTATKLGSSTVGSASRPIYLNAGTATQIGYTIEKSVPSNAVFTDTNNAVTQTATSTNANYEILFSGTADNTTRTEGARKHSTLTCNPNTGIINCTRLWASSDIVLKYSNVWAQVATISSNGTLNVLSPSSWMNLRTANVQCRNSGDTGWSTCAASAFNINSSIRYKENIEDISDEDASKLLNVRVVKYDYKENVTDEEHRYNRHGVIAEEVDEVIPEVVTYAIPYGHEEEFDEPVPDSVDYASFVPYLIKMVQMQQKEIDDLKKQVNYLFNQNNT